MDAAVEAGGDTFWTQFVGSCSANVLTMVAVGIFIGLRKLCNRKSKCKSHIHCCCLDLDVRDQTERGARAPRETKAEGTPESV